ncbi:MAG: type II toxin-antitoxin system HicA family toxin [Clostridia bacterium]|nr:type II toxin-antitoxin system HicA family toxin [Clostridia bacterium]
MKSYSSREVILMLKADGWEHIGTTGDHYHFKHPTKPGKVTVPHPSKDLFRKTLGSIEKQSGLRFGESKISGKRHLS